MQPGTMMWLAATSCANSCCSRCILATCFEYSYRHSSASSVQPGCKHIRCAVGQVAAADPWLCTSGSALTSRERQGARTLLQRLAVLDKEEHVEYEVEACRADGRVVLSMKSRAASLQPARCCTAAWVKVCSAAGLVLWHTVVKYAYGG